MQTPTAEHPSRFRSAPERSERLGRQLKRRARVVELDEDLMERIGRAMNERDEVGHRLALAIRDKRVTMTDLRTAISTGLDTVGDPDPVLVDFIDACAHTPDWVDRDLVEAGGLVMNRLGQNAADVLLQLSLIGGYRFGGPTELLAATGGLAGAGARRRLAETQKWTISLAAPGALVPPTGGRPGGQGWQLTVHVRAMHALVNASFEPRWDTARWGLPINQCDQASTLGLFAGVLVLGCRGLGVPIDSEQSHALLHLWRYVGHLLGVADDLTHDTEREHHRFNYHILMAQAAMDESGPPLARAIVEAQATRRYAGWPDALQAGRARFEHERLLSMLTTFLGAESMREFGLNPRPPWAFAYLLPLNTARYRVLARLPGGDGVVQAWGRRVSQRVLDSYFAGEPQEVGPLRP